MKEILYSCFEMKQMSEPKDGYATFTGYASVFDYVDNQMDTVARGAFSKSLTTRKTVKMLWHHDETQPIGLYPILQEDTKGLFVEGQICLAAQKGQECYGLMKQGAIDSLSIGYKTKEADIAAKTGVRTIKVADLFEISPVTFPANDKAMITGVKSWIVRPPSLKDLTIKEFERKLRDVFKCSQSEAKAIASKGFSSVTHRDGDEGETPAWMKVLSQVQSQLTT